MTMTGQSSAEAGPSTGPHRMRITTGGSLSAYIRFALSFLNDNPHRPLVLHTMPPSMPAEQSSKKSQSNKSRATSLHTATTSAPRLISVVEQIKREYIEQSGTKGKRPSRGIWQYTESGLLPIETAAEDEDPLIRVLEGKTKPKMTHHPYLQITLSTTPLGIEDSEAGRNVTCQYVMAKRKRGAAAKKFVEDNVAQELVAMEEADGTAGKSREKVTGRQGAPKPRVPGALAKGQKRKSEPDAGRPVKRTKGKAGEPQHQAPVI